YAKFLRRSVDSFGRSVWDGFLAGGGTLEEGEANNLASPEDFQAQGGGTNMGWAGAGYRDVVGRPNDTGGLSSWTSVPNNGDRLLKVAKAMLGSLEVDMLTVTAYYRQFLRRDPEPGGLATFTNALQVGATNEEVLAAIVGSPEYFQRFCQM